MCDICGRAICPVGCPSFRSAGEDMVFGICDGCRREILQKERRFIFRRGLLCEDCVRGMDVEGLIRMQGLRGMRGLLLELDVRCEEPRSEVEEYDGGYDGGI